MFNRKLKKRLEAGFGRVPDPMYFHGDMEYIRAYFDFRKENNMDEFLIDCWLCTWKRSKAVII